MADAPQIDPGTVVRALCDEGILSPRSSPPGLEHDPRRHGVGGTGVGPTASDRP